MHRIGLLTTDQYMGALAKAGLSAEHDPEGLFQRGLFVARLEGYVVFVAGGIHAGEEAHFTAEWSPVATVPTLGTSAVGGA